MSRLAHLERLRVCNYTGGEEEACSTRHATRRPAESSPRSPLLGVLSSEPPVRSTHRPAGDVLYARLGSGGSVCSPSADRSTQLQVRELEHQLGPVGLNVADV